MSLLQVETAGGDAARHAPQTVPRESEVKQERNQPPSHVVDVIHVSNRVFSLFFPSNPPHVDAGNAPTGKAVVRLVGSRPILVNGLSVRGSVLEVALFLS